MLRPRFELEPRRFRGALQSLASYDRCIDQRPTHVELLNNRGNALRESFRHAEALAMWESQPSGVPVLFNRGMALLFLGRPADARGPLTQAVAGLKETDAWYHLAQLYLTLAAARG